jgi:hypothetical protein
LREFFVLLSFLASVAVASAAAHADPPRAICPTTDGLDGDLRDLATGVRIAFRSTGSTECDPLTQPMPKPDPNAGLKEEPSDDPHCPSGTARVDNFCIDRFHAELVELRPNGTEVPWSPYHNPGKAQVRAVSLRGAIPQGNITADQAAAACDASGKRLCTDAEWLRACQGPGPNKRMFPYGGKYATDRVPGRCNDIPRALHPPVELWLHTPADKRPGDAKTGPYLMMQNACVLQRPDTLTRTGSLEKCVTPEGVYDMIGELHQWTSGRTPGGNGIFRGGYFMDQSLNGPGCYYATTAHAPSHWDYSTGFRCCSNLKN